MRASLVEGGQFDRGEERAVPVHELCPSLGDPAASARNASANAVLNPTRGESRTALGSVWGGRSQLRTPATSTAAPAASRYASVPAAVVRPGCSAS